MRECNGLIANATAEIFGNIVAHYGVAGREWDKVDPFLRENKEALIEKVDVVFDEVYIINYGSACSAIIGEMLRVWSEDKGLLFIDVFKAAIVNIAFENAVRQYINLLRGE